MKKLFLCLFFTLCSPTFAMSKKDPCLDRRGALDLGSGSTKALVAVVNTCDHFIVKVLLSESTPISFQESLEKSPQQEINSEVIEEAHVKYLALVKSMNDMDVSRIRAVATSTFRKARNGKAAAEKIAKGSKVPLQILTQKEEASLGVLSALTQAKSVTASHKKPVGVWDIGGGSMQMSYPGGPQKGLQIYEGDLASVSFKNKVIAEVLKKDPRKINSPNPLEGHYQQALQLAQKVAKESTSQDFQTQASNLRWLGIGGVWWHSVKKQVNGKDSVITQKDLEKALKKQSHLDDQHIGGAYASTDVTNLALVLGYMKVLHINEVTPVQASLVQGLVLEETE